jgi:hypothetical protein
MRVITRVITRVVTQSITTQMAMGDTRVIYGAIGSLNTGVHSIESVAATVTATATAAAVAATFATCDHPFHQHLHAVEPCFDLLHVN